MCFRGPTVLCVVFESLEDLYSSQRDIPLQNEQTLQSVLPKSEIFGS